MANFLELLQNNDDIRFALLFASLGFAVFLESLIPFVDFQYRKLRHIGINLVFLLTSGIVTGVLAFIQYGVDTVDGSQDLSRGFQFGLPWNPSVKTDY